MNLSKIHAGLFAALVGALVMAAPIRADEATKKITVDIKVGTGIQGHDLSGEAVSFDESAGLLIGWTWVKGAAEPTEIQHAWIYKGVVVSSVTLAVKSSSFRTYSRKSIAGKPGSWDFQVKDASGNILGHQAFQVTASTPAK